MAPPKKVDLIKGQASLASFFSGGGPSLAAGAAAKSQKEASNEGVGVAGGAAKSNCEKTSPKKKGGSNSKGESQNGSGLDRQQVTEIKDKITVAGYKASPSSSPVKAKTPTKREVEEMKSEASSKYFKDSKSSGKKNDAIDISDSSDEDEKPVQRKKASTSTNSRGSKPNTQAINKRKQLADSDSDSDFDFKEKPSAAKKGRPASKPTTPAKGGTSSKKTSPRKNNSAKKPKKSNYDDDDDDDEFDDMDFDLDDEDFEMLDDIKHSSKAKPNGKVASASTSNGKATSTSTSKAKAEATEVKNEEVPQEKDSKSKFNWAEAKKKREAGPALPGSKEIPVGKPNCLSGLTLVFTGELSSLSREEATDLAKRYGAKVTSALSSKTSYVVMGVDAGKSKIEKQKQLKTKILDEDGFLGLISEKSAGPIKIDDATRKKMEEEKKKIETAARELQKPAKGSSSMGLAENALWTVRYAPQTFKDLVGNGSSINKLQEWLRDWQKSAAAGFKKPGKHAMNIFRAVLISGPPGIGKTSAAHIVAKMEGYTPIELNASDVRSKKLIEASLNDTINNSSLDSWYSGGKAKVSSTGVTLTDRTVLIMDEVDGMSGGDRGGVGAINALIKKTKVPIICICNDAKNPKMTPMLRTCAQLKFIKPDATQARRRLMTIAVAEKLKIEPEVMDQLIQAAQSDIRLVINMLATWALDKKRSMDFDEGKNLGAANVKPGMHTPFSLYSALSAAGLWNATSKKTLNDKTDYYFQDHAFMPLMVQQNYINQTPSSVNRFTGKERDVHLMQTITKAAASISDGDVVDRMIHSSEQHWSLMPFHGIMSCVKPMSYCNGSSPSFPMFSSWLGQNSKQQRLTRAATELQARMRLVTAASRFEVREQYLPYFFPRLIKPLLDAKQSGNTENAVTAIVDFMDDYFLTLEDRDTVLELGMDQNNGEEMSKKIPTAAKSAFTRKYNSATHPVAFYKGTDIGAKAKKLVGAPAPDVEEAVEAEEVPDDDSADGNSDIEIDVSKDKFFKQKNAKGKGKGKK